MTSYLNPKLSSHISDKKSKKKKQINWNNNKKNDVDMFQKWKTKKTRKLLSHLRRSAAFIQGLFAMNLGHQNSQTTSNEKFSDPSVHKHRRVPLQIRVHPRYRVPCLLPYTSLMHCRDHGPPAGGVSVKVNLDFFGHTQRIKAIFRFN